MAARRIQLVRFAAKNVNYRYYGAYRLRVEARGAEGPDLTNHVFVLSRRPVDPETNETCDDFEMVASPYELAVLPRNAPDPAVHPTWFLSDVAEVDVLSTEIGEKVWRCISQEVCILVEAMNRLEVLEVVETLWCPAPPDESEIVEPPPPDDGIVEPPADSESP